jgi:hypothetical protein
MSGLPDGTPAGVTLESDAPRRNNSSGGVRYLESRRALAIYITINLLRLHQASAKY